MLVYMGGGTHGTAACAGCDCVRCCDQHTRRSSDEDRSTHPGQDHAAPAKGRTVVVESGSLQQQQGAAAPACNNVGCGARGWCWVSEERRTMVGFVS